jgi:hypothetical protein
LDPGRRVLFDPTEGHELQVTNETLREMLQSLRLTLSRLHLPAVDTPPPWASSFQHAKTLTRNAGTGSSAPDRPIRAVSLETSVFKSGGSPDQARSFAQREALQLAAWAEASINALAVPESEWRRVDGAAPHAAVYAKAGAASGAVALQQSQRSQRRI